MRNVLYVAIPAYNEAAVIDETSKRLQAEFKRLREAGLIAASSKVVFVDDGSKDDTWKKIEALPKDVFVGIKLAHNSGHQNALLAGIMYAKGKADVIISMDADLQDDIGAMEKMLVKYDEGNEIVYGVRSSREKDTFFKKNTALAFYKVMRMLGVDIVPNHADYRLMSKRAVEALAEYREVNLFLRGVIPLIGLKYTTVEYARGNRFAGESKYPLSKMLNFAIDGITSFSVKPLRIITSIGLLFSLVAFIMIVYSVVVFFLGRTVSGWTFTICSIWLAAGLQMIAFGVIGEYIGKIYHEVKARPRYLVEKITE
jgi:glycosyltransferase involved in cell wall biosynthesis